MHATLARLKMRQAVSLMAVGNLTNIKRCTLNCSSGHVTVQVNGTVACVPGLFSPIRTRDVPSTPLQGSECTSNLPSALYLAVKR